MKIENNTYLDNISNIKRLSLQIIIVGLCTAMIYLLIKSMV